MPPNTRAYLVRRVHQADHNAKKALGYLSEVWVTIGLQHPDLALALALECILLDLDTWRGTLRHYYERTLDGPTDGLHNSGDLARIMANASPVPSPEKRD